MWYQDTLGSIALVRTNNNNNGGGGGGGGSPK